MNIIITGASSGIGLELARLFVKDGHQVYVTGRRADRLLALQAEAPDQYRIKVFDVTDRAATDRAFREMCDDFGQIDIVVVNAGWGEINKPLDWAVEHAVIQTNVTGAAHIAVLAMQVFYRQNRGHLVGISSIAALLGGSLNPAYNASKAFLSNFLSGLRKAAKARRQAHIYISDIRPGFVKTDMVKGDQAFWVQPLDKAALQIYRAIEARKKIAYVTKRWGLIGRLLRYTGR